MSKKPKRPFQKCIEVPSDYLPMKNNINNKEINNIIITENNNNNNKITPSKSASNLMKLENNIKKSFSINKNKIEETKNDENEKITSEEEQRRIILIKGEVFKNLKTGEAKYNFIVEKAEKAYNKKAYNKCGHCKNQCYDKCSAKLPVLKAIDKGYDKHKQGQKLCP